MTTFEFLADLPRTVDVWLKKGVDSVFKSGGIKSIMEGSGSQEKNT